MTVGPVLLLDQSQNSKTCLSDMSNVILWETR